MDSMQPDFSNLTPDAWMWTVENGAGWTSKSVGFEPSTVPGARNTPLFASPKNYAAVLAMALDVIKLRGSVGRDQMSTVERHFDDLTVNLLQTLVGGARGGPEATVQPPMKESNG